MSAAQTKTIPKAPPGGKEDCPKGRINFGAFFDGTWNDNRNGHAAKTGSNTNVAKLHDLYITDALAEKIYVEGVGTSWYSKHIGGATGAGGKERVIRAYTAVVKFFNKGNNPYALQKVVDVFGFSRGAAQARDFVNRVLNVGIPDHSKPPTGKDPQPTFGPPKPPGPHSLAHARMSGVHVRFLGIFDTVGSFGMPGDNVDKGYNFNVNGRRVESTAHAIAGDERRYYFPLQSIKSHEGGALPGNMEEKRFSGAHSNVGGGYARTTEHSAESLSDMGDAGNPGATPQVKTNDAAKVPLKWVYDKAVAVGVEMKPFPNDADHQPSDRFKELDAKRKDDPAAAAAFEREFIHDEAKPKEKVRNTFYQGPQPDD